MEREQFTFYASFAKAIQKIRKAADRAMAYDAVVNYALSGIMPDLDKLPDSVGIVFELVRPNLDASRRKANGGKKGSKGKDTDKIPESSEEDTDKITGSSEEDTDKTDASTQEDTDNKKENKKEKEDKKEDKKENKKEDKCPLPPPPLTEGVRESLILQALGAHSPELIETVRDWTKYKIEKRQPYKETGYKSLLTQIDRYAREYGDRAVIDIIQQSMSNNYQGILFDRLQGSAGGKQSDAAAEMQRRYQTSRNWANGRT